MGVEKNIEVEIFLDELRDYFFPVIGVDDKKLEIKTTGCDKKTLMQYLEGNLFEILPAMRIHKIEIVKVGQPHPKTNYNCVIVKVNVEYE